MKTRISILTALVLISIHGSPARANYAMHVSGLRCENLVDPLGIGQPPELSWLIQSQRRGEMQTAYQVLVATSRDMLNRDQGDLWDTGKVDSDESAHLHYAGKPLPSRTACFWKVRVWTDAGPCPWSDVGLWTMGLLTPTDWQAKWIDSHEAAMQSAPIKIIHATYGTEARKKKPASVVDVTAKLTALVAKNGLNVVIDNQTLGEDPAHDLVKELTLDYEKDGQTYHVIVGEGDTLANMTSALWYLRKSFDIQKPVQKATLYVTALGLYEVHINGQRVGDHVLAPDWTDFNKRLRYQAYDVTGLVNPGENAMGALLANGWYAGHLGNGGFQQYGKVPALLAQLEITYADGSTDLVMSDGSWKTHESPLLASDFMLGETYDARHEIAGWDQPKLNAASWQPASVRQEAAREMDSQVSPPVRETGVINPIALTEPTPGHWTFDLGQNMVGVVRLKVTAPAGTRITLHHAEMLNPDGTVYTANLRKAISVDVYTCKGGGEEIWQPRFTFHGFRYVEVTGLPGKPPMDCVTGVIEGSDTPRTGTFVCSDARINKLVSNIQWGQRGNYLSVPTDCPQRDERLGWMGDAEAFVHTATENADISTFFEKWLVDVDDAQENGAFTDVSPRRAAGSGTPAWGDAGVICPWTIYQAYGDKRILERHLPAMTQWIEWCRTHSTNLIRDKDRGGDYGDWLAINAKTPKDLLGTAYFAYSTHLVAEAYKAVGNDRQAAKYQQLFQDIKTAFDKKYVSPDGHIQGDTQSDYVMALKFDLLPDSLRPAAAQYLVDDIKAKDWHLSTGFVGVSGLLPMLTESGHNDVAYKLLMQDTFPSWLFPVKNGATTIWERWDGWTPDKGFQSPTMNSFNHYSLGSCGEWLYDTAAGIGWDPDHPGYKHIIFHPLPGGGLSFAKATIGSAYGFITSGWTIGDGKLTLNLTVPANTTATVFVPADPNSTVTESGKPADQAEGVKFLLAENGAKVYEIGSGSYAFEVNQ